MTQNQPNQQWVLGCGRPDPPGAKTWFADGSTPQRPQNAPWFEPTGGWISVTWRQPPSLLTVGLRVLRGHALQALPALAPHTRTTFGLCNVELPKGNGILLPFLQNRPPLSGGLPHFPFIYSIATQTLRSRGVPIVQRHVSRTALCCGSSQTAHAPCAHRVRHLNNFSSK